MEANRLRNHRLKLPFFSDQATNLEMVHLNQPRSTKTLVDRSLREYGADEISLHLQRNQHRSKIITCPQEKSVCRGSSPIRLPIQRQAAPTPSECAKNFSMSMPALFCFAEHQWRQPLCHILEGIQTDESKCLLYRTDASRQAEIGRIDHLQDPACKHRIMLYNSNEFFGTTIDIAG